MADNYRSFPIRVFVILGEDERRNVWRVASSRSEIVSAFDKDFLLVKQHASYSIKVVLYLEIVLSICLEI